MWAGGVGRQLQAEKNESRIEGVAKQGGGAGDGPLGRLYRDAIAL